MERWGTRKGEGAVQRWGAERDGVAMQRWGALRGGGAAQRWNAGRGRVLHRGGVRGQMGCVERWRSWDTGRDFSEPAMF